MPGSLGVRPLSLLTMLHPALMAKMSAPGTKVDPMAPGTNDNPLLQDTPLPRFDAIAPEQVEPAISRLLAGQRARVAQIEAEPQPSFKTVVEPLEELQHPLSRAWSPGGRLHAAMTSGPPRRPPPP